jgi:hypothetical protein
MYWIRSLVVYILFNLEIFRAQQQQNFNGWSWIAGPSISGAAPIYGKFGVSTPLTFPGARIDAISFEPLFENNSLCIFGGALSAARTSLYNDLWCFDLNQSNWKWIAGYSQINHPGNLECPKARCGSASWSYVDSSIVYLFGGWSGTTGLSDLWKFDFKSLKWVLLKIFSDLLQKYSIDFYSSNSPGKRFFASSWIHPANADLVFLLGGSFSGIGDRRADFWCLSFSILQWKWISDPTVREFHPSNRYSAESWIFGPYLFLFGGSGISDSPLNDLWRYSIEDDIWSEFAPSNNIKPSGRWAYGAASSRNTLFIFGGTNSSANQILRFQTYGK